MTDTRGETGIHRQRIRAWVDGEVVVSLIGMRINRLWIYNNMPLFDLAGATAAIPASGALESAGARIRGRQQQTTA